MRSGTSPVGSLFPVSPKTRSNPLAATGELTNANREGVFVSSGVPRVMGADGDGGTACRPVQTWSQQVMTGQDSVVPWPGRRFGHSPPERL